MNSSFFLLQLKDLSSIRNQNSKKEIIHDIHSGTTLGEILNTLAKKYGKDFEETIDIKTGQVDVNTLVMLNGKNVRDTDLKLKNNDLIIITVPVGGG